MVAQTKRSPNLFWPYHYFSPWPHSQHTPYGVAPYWHLRWSMEQEKDHLAAHIQFLEEELEAAKEHLEQLNETDAISAPGKGARTLTRQQVRDIVGPVDENKIDAIVSTGIKLEDISEAHAMATGKRDIVGSGEQPLPGSVMAVYLILTSGES